jgi:hypothetical protein
LLYTAPALIGNSYTLYWLEANLNSPVVFTIRRVSCTITLQEFPNRPVEDCTLSTFHTGGDNYYIGDLVISGSNMFFTESNAVDIIAGLLRRKALAGGGSAQNLFEIAAILDDRVIVAGDWIYFSYVNGPEYRIDRLRRSAAPIVRDLHAKWLEVTQRVQNKANQAMLFENQPTYVQFYGGLLTGPNAAGVTAKLFGTRNGQPLPGSPLRPENGLQSYNANPNDYRGYVNASYLFRLPSSWDNAGAISLRAVIDPEGVYPDTNTGNNEVIQGVNFNTMDHVCVVSIPVRTHNPLPNFYDQNNPQMIEQFRVMWPTKLYFYPQEEPLEEVEFCSWHGIPYPCHGPYELDEGWGIGGPPDRDGVNIKLSVYSALTFEPSACEDDDGATVYWGMVANAAASGAYQGNASRITPAFWSKLAPLQPYPKPQSWDSFVDMAVLGQEMAHTFNRKHVDCGNPDYVDNSWPYTNKCQLDDDTANGYLGFDRLEPRTIAAEFASDFMSYRPLSGESSSWYGQWISGYTNNALRGEMAAAEAESVAAAAMEAPTAGRMLAAGTVDALTMDGALSRLYLVPDAATAAHAQQVIAEQLIAASHHEHENDGHIHGAAADASYKLRLIANTGATLTEIPLTLLPLDDHNPATDAYTFLTTFTPPAGKVVRVELLADADVLDSLSFGATAPVVTLSAPAAGLAVSAGLTVAWQSADPDGDKLLHTVQYSYDNGGHWQTLAMDMPPLPDTNSMTLVLPTGASIRGSAPNAARIRVMATDGYNTTTALSAGFTVLNRAPQVTLAAPLAGGSYPAGNALPLSASAIDQEDGVLPDGAYQWSVDGQLLGDSPQRSAPGLGGGSHTAAITVTDSAGARTAVNANFTVLPLAVGEAVSAPAVDGYCEDAVWNSAKAVEVAPYGNGNTAVAMLLRSGSNLYACVHHLARGSDDQVGSVSLTFDPDESRNGAPQVDDNAFFVKEDGSFESRTGDGSNWDGAGATGLQAQISASGAFWQAELVFPLALADEGDGYFGFSAGHSAVATANDSYRWPWRSTLTRPASWSRAVLGSQPWIRSLNPGLLIAGSAAFSLTVTGDSFTAGSEVQWNSQPLSTTWVNTTTLIAQVPAAKVTTAGSATVSVLRDGLVTSPGVFFGIQQQAPTLTALSPAAAKAETAGFQLTITGTNFVPGAVLNWNGAPLATTFASSTKLTAQVPAGNLALGGTVSVVVQNPAPVSQDSNSANFTILPATFKATLYLPVIGQ